MGRYLPSRVVTNADVEDMIGQPRGYVETTKAGVFERRWVTDETSSFMSAEAAKEAIAEAGLKPKDIDLIINASGSQEQAIPDGAPLIQRHLGLGDSGIACMTIHVTCLGFIKALHLAACYLALEQYRNILICSGEIASAGINRNDHESFILFGDGAGAVVLTRTPEGEPSKMTNYVFRTFGDGAYMTSIAGGGTRLHPQNPKTKPEDNLFRMDGKEVYLLAMKHAPRTLGLLRPTLAMGLGDVKAVISHQASGLALRALAKFGWPEERIVKTIHKYGNTIAASIPITLYEAARERKMLNRGDEILFVGTGAGLSIGAAIITY
jgi:3-oxoacyl-[acyl-carrier-protein] synthase-3